MAKSAASLFFVTHNGVVQTEFSDPKGATSSFLCYREGRVTFFGSEADAYAAIGRAVAGRFTLNVLGEVGYVVVPVVAPKVLA